MSSRPLTSRAPVISRPEAAGIAFIVVISVVTVFAAQGHGPRIATAVLMTLAEAGLLVGRHAPAPVRRWGLAVTAACSLAALLVAPNGLAEIPAATVAARLPTALPERGRQVAVGVLAVAFGVAVAVAAHSFAGLLAGVGIVVLAQRTVQRAELQTEHDRAVALLAEVQASRDAQAETAASGERARIAQEMHDVLAHSLAGLSIQLQAARAIAIREGIGAAVTGPLDKAAELAREGVAEARAAVGALSAGHSPGIAAVGALVNRFPGAAALHVTGVPVGLEPGVGHAVYRVVQESLTNAARYAPGAPVSVTLHWEAARLVLTVSDPGTHRPAAALPEATGTGLTGLVERVALIGGRLTAGPAAGSAGWTVRAEFPARGPAGPA